MSRFLTNVLSVMSSLLASKTKKTQKADSLSVERTQRYKVNLLEKGISRSAEFEVLLLSRKYSVSRIRREMSQGQP